MTLHAAIDAVKRLAYMDNKLGKLVIMKLLPDIGSGLEKLPLRNIQQKNKTCV